MDVMAVDAGAKEEEYNEDTRYRLGVRLSLVFRSAFALRTFLLANVIYIYVIEFSRRSFHTLGS